VGNDHINQDFLRNMPYCRNFENNRRAPTHRDIQRGCRLRTPTHFYELLGTPCTWVTTLLVVGGGKSAVEHVRPPVIPSTKAPKRAPSPAFTPRSCVSIRRSLARLFPNDLFECRNLRESPSHLPPFRVEGSAAVVTLTPAPSPALSKVTVKLRPSRWRC
jgi:hypothetical protein